MRVFAQCAAVGTLAVVFAISGPISAQTKDPAAILASARQALGGEKKLTAVKSFTATGRTRQVRGDNLVPIEFEVFVELPDKYLRKDEIPAQESGPTASGFNGDEWLQDPAPPAPPAPPAGPAPAGAPGGSGAPGGAPAGPRPNPSAARVVALKQDFTRLALGMFATSFPSYPLTFTYVGEAEAPQGKADVLEAKGPANFTLRLFIDKTTHLPLMVSWTPPVPAGRGPMRGGMPGMPPGAAPGGPGPGGAPPAGRGGPPAGAPSTAAPAGAPPAATPPATPPSSAAPPAGAPPAAPPPAGAPPAGAPPAGVRGASPAGERGAGPAGQRGAPPAQAPVENRLYFADYRDVDGMQFPFRLRRAVGPDTIEETTFDRYKVNGKIDPKKFEVRKPQ